MGFTIELHDAIYLLDTPAHQVRTQCTSDKIQLNAFQLHSTELSGEILEAKPKVTTTDIKRHIFYVRHVKRWTN